MSYISSKYSVSDSNVTASNTSWVTVVETATINMVPGSTTKARIHAGWRATASVLAGDVRVVIHDGSQDIELDSWTVSVGADDRTACFEHAPAVSPEALHKAKIQIRAGSALSSTTINAGDAWVEMFYLTT